MSESVPVHTHVPTRRVTGDAARWARDFALLGAFSGGGAILGFFGSVDAGLAVTAAVTGMATGAVLGAAMPSVLDVVRKRLPIKVLMFLGLPVGAVWGATTGVSAMALAGNPQTFGGGVPMDMLFTVMALVAGLAGALMFGAVWFPYTFQTVRGGRTWPVVAGACLLTPALGWLGVFGFIALLG